MRLSEYPDDELIEEIKHRGLKIEVTIIEWSLLKTAQGDMPLMQAKQIKIGGVRFDISK